MRFTFQKIYTRTESREANMTLELTTDEGNGNE